MENAAYGYAYAIMTTLFPDGKTWHKYPWGFDMQGYHHNTLGEFLSLRPGIYAGGEGEVHVTDFTYRTL